MTLTAADTLAPAASAATGAWPRNTRGDPGTTGRRYSRVIDDWLAAASPAFLVVIVTGSVCPAVSTGDAPAVLGKATPLTIRSGKLRHFIAKPSPPPAPVVWKASTVVGKSLVNV